MLLISPYFLQERGSRLLRTPALTTPVLKRISADRLAAVLGVRSTEAIASAAAQLRRPVVARRTAGWLRAGNHRTERAALQALLSRAESVVHIVAGQQDPLIGDPGPATVTTIPGAGHHPQLTHLAAIAKIMRRFTNGATRQGAGIST